MRNIAVLVLVLMVGGCGSDALGADDGTTSSAGTGSSVGTTSSSEVPVTAGASPTTIAPETSAAATPETTIRAEEDLVAFIATLEELLAGTSYEGEALNEPDVFVATGRLLCERLDRGDDLDDVLSAYLDQLAGGVAIATDDELVLTGALLGAAAGALCPQHGAQLE